MLLQCILLRRGGTTIELLDDSGATVTYHFKPKPGAEHEHLCEVDNEAHIHRLLCIPEAYRMYASGAAQNAASIVKPARAATRVDVEETQAPSVVDAIRDLSVRDLKATIARYSNEELGAALAAEQAAAEPRKSWIEVVRAQMGDAA